MIEQKSAGYFARQTRHGARDADGIMLMEDAEERRYVRGQASPEPGIVFMTMLNGIYDKEAKPNTRGMIQSYNADKFDDILLRLRLSLFTLYIHHIQVK